MMAMPVYNDGYFTLYHIDQGDGVVLKTNLVRDETIIDMWYEELSVSDRLKSQLNATSVDVAMKIRIPQCRRIDSMCVLKIGDRLFKVYTAYHFTNGDGIAQSDLTLTNWEGAYELYDD